MPGYDYSATLALVDGRVIVTQADEVILVIDSLWRELEQVDERPGAPVISDHVLSFGLVGEGLGRLSYRYVCFVPTSGHHVLERIR
jgi:hypothetical protein